MRRSCFSKNLLSQIATEAFKDKEKEKGFEQSQTEERIREMFLDRQIFDESLKRAFKREIVGKAEKRENKEKRRINDRERYGVKKGKRKKRERTKKKLKKRRKEGGKSFSTK